MVFDIIKKIHSMGYMVELNTLLGLPKDFDASKLEINTLYTIDKLRERAFPLHIAVLVVDHEWNFYGYANVHSATVGSQNTRLEFEMITLFSKEESQLYKNNFIKAAKITGEL